MVNIEGTTDVSLSVSGINLEMAMNLISVLTGMKVVSDGIEKPDESVRVYMHRNTENNYKCGDGIHFNKIACIKVFREITGFGLNESKDFVEYAPASLTRGMIEKLLLCGIRIMPV